MMTNLEQIQDTLAKLIALYPESLDPEGGWKHDCWFYPLFYQKLKVWWA